MPARESSLRSAVIEALIHLDAVAVENPALPGTPDVNYVEGWIELKSVPKWPVQHHVTIKLEHWTPQQKVWHLRRSRVGGQTYVMLEAVVPGDILLLRGETAAKILGAATRQELAAVALAEWPSRAEMKAQLPSLLRSLRDTSPRA